jgi:gamma-glutamyltranspeptidase/glutathione hydrolase
MAIGETRSPAGAAGVNGGQQGATPTTPAGNGAAPASEGRAVLPAAGPGLPSHGPRYGRRGMVVSASAEAAAAGLRVLMDGGNAFDAAIAAALVEGIALPGSCGLGGDMFAVLHDARTGEVHAINGSGVAPQAMSRDFFVSRGYATMPLAGIHSASVPGAPDAYWTLHQRFGSRPWAKLVEPAIRFAEEGIAVSPALARTLAGAARKVREHSPPAAVEAFFAGGEAPPAGAVFRRPALARTLGTYAAEGARPFYRGAIAEELVRASAAAGGLFTGDDFAGHETEVYPALRTSYRGVDVYETRPPSQGLIVLEWLNLLEGFDLAAAGFGTAETIHLLVETKKLAFADRLRYAGDPRFVATPLDELLSIDFATRRRRAFDPERAALQVEGALPEALHGDTSYFCVADGEGNAISFIHSLSAGFGSGVVGGATGIVLNNRAGRGFTLEAGHPNVVEGGKRTMHTLNCYLLLRDGRFWVAGGTPGGDQQPQWNVQTICNLVDFGMDVQQAVEAPRWFSFPGTDPADAGKPVALHLESRFDPEVVDALAARGHAVVPLGPWGTAGRVQLIAREPNGVLRGACDPRSAGAALGW